MSDPIDVRHRDSSRKAKDRSQVTKARPKNLREQQKEFTKARLIEAARDLMTERGYVAVTVDDIVATAGASRATFYLHFRTKADIAVEVAEAHREITRGWYPALDAILADGSVDDLQAWFTTVVEYYDEKAPIIKALREAAYVEQAIREDFVEFVRQAVESMPRHLSRWPEESHDEARLRLFLMIFQFDQFLEFRRERLDGFSTAMVSRTLTDIWWTALRSD